MNIPWYVHFCYTIDMKNIRKIVKNGRQSYYINIPKDLMRELKWRERQKMIITKRGNKIIVTDWEK